MKRKFSKILGVGLVLALLISLLLMMAPVSASTPVVPPTGEHFTFNCVTEVPEGELGPYEILVPLSGSGMLGFTEGSTFMVLDNDMTDDNQALVQVPAGMYDTYDQVRGKPGGILFWGNSHTREVGKPTWEQHNDPLNWYTGRSGNWMFTNDRVTCYTFRLY